VLKCCNNDDIVTLKSDETADAMTFMFENQQADRISDFELKLMDIDSEHLGIPDTDYKCTVQVRILYPFLVTLRYLLLYHLLAFATCSFTSRLLCTNQPSLQFPRPPVHPDAILLHDCWTVYDSPSDLPFLCYTPYTIGNNNIL